MSEKAQPGVERTTSPASLLSQWWTLGTITADRRTTGRHAKVAWVIIDRYRQDFGNGRASVRYIARACDLSASIVAKACRELVEWGYFSQNIGIGTRPTEFTPNWATVPPLPHAKAVEISVLQGSNTCVPQGSNASSDSVLPVSDESYLPYPADKTGLRVSRNEFEAAPMAPLAAGPEAAAAVPASGGFDRFWSIWPRKHGKKKSQAVWKGMTPDQQALALDRSPAWAAHYETHGVEMKWIPEPSNWLKGERWDEDLPIIHDDAKGAAIAKAKAKANARAAPAPVSTQAKKAPTSATFMVGKISPWTPFGTFTAEIIGSEVSDYGYPGDDVVCFHINWSGQQPNGDWPEDTWHEFLVYSQSAPELTKGREMFNSIAAAVGLDTVEDTEEMHHRPFLCTIHDDLSISYAPLPANDNARPGGLSMTSG